MRLVILGGPGAGKGTQAVKLSQYWGIPLVSVGDLLREAIELQTALGKIAANYVGKGDLVPDETMIAFIRERLLKPDANSGWILDGYPRTAFQAEELDFLLNDLGQKLDFAIWLNVSIPILIERSCNRGRSDDTPDIVQRRIDLFHQRTMPMLEYYNKRLVTINGDEPADDVLQNILKSFNT